MGLTARDVMASGVKTVGPEMKLSELERSFLEDRVSGYPVVARDGRLVGVVSRSDVVRQLNVERARAEQLSEFYVDLGGFDPPRSEDLAEVAQRMGARLEDLTVGDAMSHHSISVAPESPLREVAAVLVEKHVHRLPVVDSERLVGILSSLDLVRLIAEERLRGA